MPIYVVKAGDTLQRIARRECGDPALAQQIARDNNLADMNRIYVGQRLVINCGPGQPAEPAAPIGPAAGSRAPLKTFRVISPMLKVREAPRTDAPTGLPLSRGSVFAAHADDWSEGEGLRWWQHARGWSATGSLDGRSVFVQDLTPDVPAAPSRHSPLPTPPAPGRVLLDVPYHSQEDLDARWAAADCGPTCVRMLIGWHALRRGRPNPPLTVDEVSRVTGMGPSRFSFPSQLVRAAARFGLRLVETREMTMERVIAELDAGRPLIALVRYGSISYRQKLSFRGGHFVVVIGYDSQHIYVNDPYWWGDRRAEGAGLAVPRREFERAIGADAWRGGNPPYWGVLVDPEALQL